MTPERVELGRYLFYDVRLSGNGRQSCASCHIQALAFTDGRARPTGSTGQPLSRSTMSLINAAYRDSLTWANPSLTTLEEQVRVPLFSTTPVELGLAGHEAQVYARLRHDLTYRQLFAAAFPESDGTIDDSQITRALAAFVRSIVSFRSPFDRYRFEDDRNALNASQQRGWQLFSGPQAGCGSCHMTNVGVDRTLNLDGGSKTVNSPANESAVFPFQKADLHNLPGALGYPADNTGLYEHTHDPSDVGKFRVPTLRNIAVTAPYMHDGSVPTLEAVLDHYGAAGRAPNPPLLSDSIEPMQLSTQDRADLLAFLDSLTDTAALTDSRWTDPWPALSPAHGRANW